MKVFVSHSLRDPMKESIGQVIHAIGAAPFFAEHQFSLDQTVSQKIEQAIHESDIFLALLTEYGFESNFVQQEIGYAHSIRKKRIILVEKGLENRISGFPFGSDAIILDKENPQEAVAKLQDILKQEISIKQVQNAIKMAEARKRELNANRLLFGLVIAIIGIVISE